MSNPLEDAGYRLTEPRRRVLDALREAPGPLTAQDVAERASASVASTYRVLALLVELGLVSETPDNGAALPGCEACCSINAGATMSKPSSSPSTRSPRPTRTCSGPGRSG